MSETAAPAAGTANWDLTAYFPALGGPEYRAFRERLAADLAALRERLRGVGPLGTATLPPAGGPGPHAHAGWVEWIEGLEDASARTTHLGSYLGCLGAADSRDEAAQAETAALALTSAELRKLFVGLRAALRAAPESAFEALLAEPRLADAGWLLRRLRERAKWSMTPELEDLAADLDTTGLSAWSRLYDRVSGSLDFELAVPGRETRRLPVSLVRSLLEDADPAVRRAALVGSNAAWERVGDVLAGCLNAISGTRLLLYRRQGVPHFLDPALFDAAISRRTLDAMLDAVRGRAGLARAYLRHKARILSGGESLGFQDLLAPLPLEGLGRVPWPEARERVLSAFLRFHPDLAGYARRAFEARWIDWEPRPAKRPGGFCSSSPVIRESRIFLTYGGAPGDVSTLAHELGHGFHAWVMRDLRPAALRYPMTLAETASTFAERLLADASLAGPGLAPAERLALLDGRMQDAAVFLLNIPMRLHFETALYEERARGELSPRRLCELMREAQRAWYGDALAEDQLDPFFWASKLHFYIAGLSFYNFPYTFGFLFSLGLYARAREEGGAFLPRYVELLRRTGRMSAEDVARSSLGVDLGDPGFWHASLDLVAEDARAFEEAAEGRWPAALA